MAVFKCKMCGGSLEVSTGMTVCECAYCGTQQTLPKDLSDAASNQFNRANNLRMKCEFDKAQELYEKIVAENPDESEAYWGIVLCHYGVEYVTDPATSKKIPTCHRTQFEAIRADMNYKSALEKASSEQKVLYEKEAAEIDELQKNILNIVHNEEPFDIFICYKETDKNGKRTEDSVITNDIYHQLTQEGLKVFYAPITLEDKIGREYEPYIFAALNSAKVLLAVGTKPEHFNAVWVKNEWSRFLKIMKKDRSKMLIPCYKNMDAYELPEEFSHFQAQDMSKIGFMQDLIRGIKKIAGKPASNITTESDDKTAPLLKRAFLYLEDKDWKNADAYCERVLDMNPENSQAYICKLMAEFHVSKFEMLADCKGALNRSLNYKNAYKYADSQTKSKLDDYNKSAIYNKAFEILKQAITNEECSAAAQLFSLIKEYKDSMQKIEECNNKAAEIKEKEENKRQEEERKKQEEQRKIQEKARISEELQKKRTSLERKLKIFSILAAIAIAGIYLLYIIISKPWEKVEACDADTLSDVFKFLFSMTKPVGIAALLIGIAAGIEDKLCGEFWVCAGSQMAIVMITMFSHGGGFVPLIMLVFALIRSLIGIIPFFISKFITSHIYRKYIRISE